MGMDFVTSHGMTVQGQTMRTFMADCYQRMIRWTACIRTSEHQSSGKYTGHSLSVSDGCGTKKWRSKSILCGQFWFQGAARFCTAENPGGRNEP